MATDRPGRPPVVWHPGYEIDIGPHVFPTRKYRLVRDRMLEEGTITRGDLLEPDPATLDEIGTVHTPGYLDKIVRGSFTPIEIARLEVPFSDGLREAMWICAGGTLLTARSALRHGIAAHLGGGFHHAFADHGEGFCLINDVAIAVRVLLREGAIDRAAIVDLDVHHGNGTAAIFAGDPRVFTFSMHQERNYPALKPPGDLDVGLEDGTADEAYLDRLAEHLPRVLHDHRPDIVFYLAGADPYVHDQLGGLALTLDGLRQRDAMVITGCREAGIPVAVLLAGGYAHRTSDTVEIHCATVRVARAAVD